MKKTGDPHGFGGPNHRTKQQWVLAAKVAIIRLLTNRWLPPESRSTADSTNSG